MGTPTNHGRLNTRDKRMARLRDGRFRQLDRNPVRARFVIEHAIPPRIKPIADERTGRRITMPTFKCLEDA